MATPGERCHNNKPIIIDHIYEFVDKALSVLLMEDAICVDKIM